MIEIKITGENAKEAVNELRALSVEFGGQTVAPQAQYPTNPPPEREPPQAVQSAPAPQAQYPDDDLDITQPDAEGYPWDERIHSGNQKQTANGVWQKRRGVDDATIAKVKAELDGESEQSDNGEPEQSAPQAEQSAPAPQPEQPAPAPQPEQPAPAAPAPAPQSSTPAPAAAESLQLKLTKALQALNNHTPGSAGPKLVEVLKKHGANTINAVPEDKQPELAAMLDKITKDPANVDSIMEGLA